MGGRIVPGELVRAGQASQNMCGRVELSHSRARSFSQHFSGPLFLSVLPRTRTVSLCLTILKVRTFFEANPGKKRDDIIAGHYRSELLAQDAPCVVRHVWDKRAFAIAYCVGTDAVSVWERASCVGKNEWAMCGKGRLRHVCERAPFRVQRPRSSNEAKSEPNTLAYLRSRRRCKDVSVRPTFKQGLMCHENCHAETEHIKAPGCVWPPGRGYLDPDFLGLRALIYAFSGPIIETADFGVKS